MQQKRPTDNWLITVESQDIENADNQSRLHFKAEDNIETMQTFRFFLFSLASNRKSNLF